MFKREGEMERETKREREISCNLVYFPSAYWKSPNLAAKMMSLTVVDSVPTA